MNSTQIAFQRVRVISEIGRELGAFVRIVREIGFILVGPNQGCNTFSLKYTRKQAQANYMTGN